MSGSDERLTEALRAEHAAIFGYGALGAHLGQKTVNLAISAESAHRARRDTLLLLLAQRGLTPPGTDPTYALPFAVTDRATALRLAVTIEERVAAVWRLALAETTGADQALALDALVDAAVRAAKARLAAGMTPATVAWPGAPA